MSEMENLEEVKNEEVKTEEKNQKRKNPIYKILIVILSIILVVTVGLMIRNWWVEREAQKKFEELANMTQDVTPDVPDIQEPEDEKIDILAQLGIEVPEKNLDWAALKEENEHIYAWIYVPNTKIDYPVLQHPTNDYYYLEHNIDGTVGYPGCIFSESEFVGTDFMDFHTVLYGHNMKNGTMFRTLHDFKDGTFFDENKYIYIYTPETVYVYEIFAAYTHSDEHLLMCYDTETESGRQYYLDSVFGIRDMSAHFRDGVEVTPQNHILTLSTCVGGAPNNRYLVQGVLLNDPTLGYK